MQVNDSGILVVSSLRGDRRLLRELSQCQLRNVETLPAVEAAIELPEIILNTNEDEKEN